MMSYAIGAVVSIIVQILKKRFNTQEFETLALVFGGCIIAATLYVFLQGTEYWDTVIQVITTAGAFYAFVIKRLED